jgi:hypothetical protein
VLRIDGYEHAVTVVSPLGIDQLRELDWYFEQHLRFPFTDQVRARQAGESITAYGEGLFGQLVADSRVREACGALKGRRFCATWLASWWLTHVDSIPAAVATILGLDVVLASELLGEAAAPAR